MSFNDGQQASHLLEWVNQQRSKMGDQIPWYSFQQISEGQFFQSILSKIDNAHFSDLFQNSFDYGQYLGQIESYLDKVYGQRIKRSFKIAMLKTESMVSLTKLIFYLSMQSPLKGQFIHRVFQLPTETQGKLMNELKSIQDCIEAITQIKDLLKKIEQLEQQNDLIKDQLKQYAHQINKLQQLYEESNQQQHKLIKQCKRYKKEKNEILQELGIVEMKQYIAIYNQIKTENQVMADTIKDIMERNKNHEDYAKVLKQTIIDNNSVISDLNDEIVRYKELLQNACLQLSCYEDNSKFNGESLKQNNIIYNTNRKSLGKNSQRDTSIPLSFDSEDCSQADKLRIYNGELMKKLELMYRKNALLNQSYQTVKKEKQQLNIEKQFLQQKLYDLKNCHARFIRNYGISTSD